MEGNIVIHDLLNELDRCPESARSPLLGMEMLLLGATLPDRLALSPKMEDSFKSSRYKEYVQLQSQRSVGRWIIEVKFASISRLILSP